MASEIAKWAIVAWCVFAALVTISQVGKPREPLKPGTAVTAVVMIAAEVVAILVFWGGSSNG